MARSKRRSWRGFNKAGDLIRTLLSILPDPSQIDACNREEAKIQAWVNLESAKAEAQSRKLEVKPNLLVPSFA